jgi:hypothetical protein
MSSTSSDSSVVGLWWGFRSLTRRSA